MSSSLPATTPNSNTSDMQAATGVTIPLPRKRNRFADWDEHAVGASASASSTTLTSTTTSSSGHGLQQQQQQEQHQQLLHTGKRSHPDSTMPSSISSNNHADVGIPLSSYPPSSSVATWLNVLEEEPSSSIVASTSSHSSSSSSNATAVVPATATTNDEDDAVKRRKDKLAQWKAKHSAAAATTSAMTSSTTTTTNSSSMATQLPPPSPPTTTTSTTSSSTAAIKQVGGVKISFGGGLKLRLGQPAASVTRSGVAVGVGSGMHRRRLGTNHEEDDDVEDRSSSVLMMASGMALGLHAPLNSMIPPSLSLADNMDERDTSVLERETNHSSKAGGGDHKEKEEEGEEEEEDELNSFMATLGSEAAAIAKAAKASRSMLMTAAPGVVTLEELISNDVQHQNLGSEASFTGSGAKTSTTTTTTNDVDDADEEEYHRMFAASLKPQSSVDTVLSKPPLPSAAAASASILSNADGSMQVATDNTPTTSSSSSTAAPSSSTSSAPLDAEDAAAAAQLDSYDDDAKLFEGEEWGEEKSALDLVREKLAKKEIKPVDHSKVEYIPIRKNFFIEAKEIRDMTEEEVASLRDDLEITVRGKNIPRPITTWEHASLPDKLLHVLQEQRGFEAPFAIQRQALPIIMSGRDIIGVARTGSGKTLAYLLPVFRQILDQPPLGEGEGPIALIMAPSRELVVQIYHEAKKLAKPLGIRTTACYGGAPVAEQIGDLKRGSEIVVCTPGRMIDLLTLNAGKLLSFSRVSYVVLDEADRMFDMGFEPQISRILAIVRPDRQTVMFSATFPSHVETLARRVLKAPVEVVVGGRSKASPHISQFVEVHPDSGFASSSMSEATNGGTSKYRRLLQLLGDWFEEGSILIFVDTKEKCDSLFADLLRAGYPASSLHGGKEQADRDQTLADFKAGIRTLLIATSVAGRGLDVRNLLLVVNYSCPNHLEDYVHRVGRTGRAGAPGTAYTFITPSEAAYAQDLVRAMKDARQAAKIPPELTKLVEEHKSKVDAGEARKRHSGYSSSKGYKFDDSELSGVAAVRKAQKLAYEVEAGITTVEDYLAEEQAQREAKESADRLDADIAAERSGGGGGGREEETGEEGDEGRKGGAGGATENGKVPSEDGASATTSASQAEAKMASKAAYNTKLAEAAQATADAAAEQVATLKKKVTFTNNAFTLGLSTAEDVAAATKALEEAEKVAAEAQRVAVAKKTAAASSAAALIRSRLSTSGINIGANKGAGGGGGGDGSSSLGDASGGGGGGGGSSSGRLIVDELEINDYPQQARLKLMKEGLSRVEEWSRTAIISRGLYVQPGRAPPPGERKLYLLIEGSSDVDVRKAKTELRRILEEETLRVGIHGAGTSQYSKFTV